MSITAADIRREVKEKNVTFIRLMFSDILGTMKNVEIPATDEQLDKVLSNKAMFDWFFYRRICPYQRVRYVSLPRFGYMDSLPLGR